MGNQLFVVMNDPVVARDLLVVHGANFSSRWNFFMKNQTILQGGAITATPYNDTWYVLRLLVQTGPDNLLLLSGGNIAGLPTQSLLPKQLKVTVPHSIMKLTCLFVPSFMIPGKVECQ